MDSLSSPRLQSPIKNQQNEGGAKFTGGIPISPDGRGASEVLSLPEMRVGADHRSGDRGD